jgi:WD40 repeat protein/tRNA A-37 threonylcarbamoyl transferase component Bud32
MPQFKPHDDTAVAVQEAPTLALPSAGSSPGSYNEPPVLTSVPPTAIPVESYEVRGEHARGGLGRVLKAEDRRLHRLVAIKELLRAGGEEARRFLREVQLTARLQHPGIVPVYEAGRWPDGTPFYVMKFVDGRTLKDVLREATRLDERLALLPKMIAIAETMAYVHSERVIHRDLKPSNVLIGPFGETVIVDWGLAKDLNDLRPDDSGVAPYRAPSLEGTMAGTILGTPAYMPPEQARGESVDERADVYSIGAMLYELLSGELPCKGDTAQEVLNEVLAGPPPPLARRAPGAPRELVAIVEKAMSRNQARRYRNAGELVEELKRFQTGQLVQAHEYSRRALAMRWILRRKHYVAAFVVSVLAITAVTTVSIRRIMRERDFARVQQARAEASRNQLTLAQARSALDHDPTAALAWLKTYPMSDATPPAVLELALDAESRGVARHVFRRDSSRAFMPSFSPDSRLVAVVQNREIQVRDVQTGKITRTLKHDGSVYSLEFSRMGDRILVVDWETTNALVWSLTSGKTTLIKSPGTQIVMGLFSPDGEHVATGSSEGAVRVWSLDGRIEATFTSQAGLVYSLAYSPDGTSLAWTSLDGTIRLGNLTTGTYALLQGRQDKTTEDATSFSPDGRWLAAPGLLGQLLVWDVKTKALRIFDNKGIRVPALAFLPDGSAIVGGCADGAVKAWDLSTGVARTIGRGETTIKSVAVSPDGKLVVAGERNGTVTVHDLAANAAMRLQGHQGDVYAIAFSRDGRHFATSANDSTTRVWDVPVLPRRLLGHTATVTDVFPIDAQHIVTASADSTVRWWDLGTGETRLFDEHHDHAYKVAVSPDRRFVATGGFDSAAWLWEPASGQRTRLRGVDASVYDIAISPDGRRVVAALENGTIVSWELETREPTRLTGHVGEVVSLAFLPDGRLVSGGRDGTVRLWDLSTGDARTIGTFGQLVNQVVVSPKGQFLAAGSWDKTVRLWSLHDGNLSSPITLSGHSGPVRSVAFSPDDRVLASASADRTLRTWTVKGEPIAVLTGHHDQVRAVRFVNDRTLASNGLDGTVRLWNAFGGQPERILQWTSGGMSTLAVLPGAETVVSTDDHGAIGMWKVGTARHGAGALLALTSAQVASDNVIFTQ